MRAGNPCPLLLSLCNLSFTSSFACLWLVAHCVGRTDYPWRNASRRVEQGQVLAGKRGRLNTILIHFTFLFALLIGHQPVFSPLAQQREPNRENSASDLASTCHSSARGADQQAGQAVAHLSVQRSHGNEHVPSV